ncbi:hypothetical protein EIN_475520 [Entamoeba invadens IP1]|uniref:Cell division cycle protein 123 n=1 Tax=Entamoeba invadens IP1 TaxID=370355 RepID=A0A0A1U9Q8_ENTIV|nr:hypothetical protein EIN_475520 [Entamoeba invadens IP1]ELP88860.1 hypothetical protein EIN_475520 [Entamoeba invadens IP1]|eukprot:XP_004255631.1 hypothetical protein EIN_475520 [Entamoeba invadens IP1]
MEKFTDEEKACYKELNAYDELDRHTNGLLEIWSDLVTEYSFNTRTFYLTRDECKSIYQRGIHNKVLRIVGENKQYKTQEFDDAHLAVVKQKIDAEISQAHWNGYFVRLGTRSPKDAFTEKMFFDFSKNLKMLFTARIESYHGQIPENWAKTFSVYDYMDYSKARFSCWKCKTSEEALSLFTNSDRVLNDIERILKLEIDPQKFEVLALREWCDELDPWYEFRAVVYKDNLTALTQYDSRFVLDNVIQNPKEVEDVVKTFFTKEFKRNFCEKRDKLQEEERKRLESYVIDFAYLQKTKTVKVVEINSFCSLCGVSLFKWEKDILVLFGKTHFEFRYNTTAPDINWNYEVSENSLKKCFEIKNEVYNQVNKHCQVV